MDNWAIIEGQVVKRRWSMGKSGVGSEQKVGWIGGRKAGWTGKWYKEYSV